MTWAALGHEAELDHVSAATIRHTMGRLDYFKCVACRRGWVNQNLAIERKAYAQIMIDRYPNKQDWWHIRFSDETHFGLGPTGRLMIIRKPGEQYYHSCIQETREPNKHRGSPEAQKAHAQAAIGHNFKSDLIFYDIPGNTNGKMTADFYVNGIFEPHVKQWIQNDPPFVLKEDRDSGHGIAKTNTTATMLVKEWKRKNHLTTYFNCSGSPDLAPIENAWQFTKHHVCKFPHFTKENTIQLATDRWEGITQSQINTRIDTMPQRLQDVIDIDGRMTKWQLINAILKNSYILSNVALIIMVVDNHSSCGAQAMCSLANFVTRVLGTYLA